MNRNELRFMSFVEQHERTWGDKHYKGRPSLLEITNATVVAFWRDVDAGRRAAEYITLHEHIREIDQVLSQIIVEWDDERFDRQLVRLFHQKRRVKIKSVTVNYELIDK